MKKSSNLPQSFLHPLVSLRRLEALLGCSRSLLWHCARNSRYLYQPFKRPKKSGKGHRVIHNPQEPLKTVQRCIKRALLDGLNFPDFIMGGIPGRSVRDHAGMHTGRRVVVSLDIQDFFGSVSADRVRSVFLEVFGASSRLAEMLTTLTTYEGYLPQGAPTSSALANLALMPTAMDISSLLTRSTEDLHFSIWCDDITVSGENAHKYIAQIVGMVRWHGFRINPGKIQIMTARGRQEVTGCIVNRMLSYGSQNLNDVINRIIRMDPEDDIRSLESLIHHVRYINQVQGDKLLRIYRRTRTF